MISDGDAGASATVTVVDSGAPPMIAADATAGRRIDRYIVVETLGQGGMGRVLRAYDPKLRREVALKLLHRTTDPTARARIVREAQAMARLSHPNIVAVFDVDVFETHPFIVMEYVEGQTLAQWLLERRSPDEVLAAFVDVARGLAAAHEAGIVHRDIKPLNLLRDGSGRVRVTDFGIARNADEAVSSGSEPSAPPESSDAGLTRLGTVIGTPPYMAPEQHEGEAADARSDQYAFCVALWEALVGSRPFEANDLAGLVAAKRALRFAPAKDGISLTPPLRAVLRRGLDPDPKRRYPSMPALLGALVHARDHGRRRQRYVATAIAVTMAAGVWGVVRWNRARDRAACETEGAAIAEVWNDGVRAQLRDALVDTGLEYAEPTADRVMPWLDDYASEWQTAATDACTAATVEHTWERDVLQAARWCLDERREELAGVLERLLLGGPAAVETAVRAASALTRIEPCRDALVLRRLPTPPVDRLEDVAATRRELARVRALIVAGSYVDALAAARTASEHAVALGWPPMIATARLRLGVVLKETDRPTEGEAELEGAYFIAAAANATEVAHDAAEELTCLIGRSQVRVAEGVRWSRQAEVLLASLPDPGSLRMALHESCRASLDTTAGDYEAAITRHEHAVEIVETTLGADHPLVAVYISGVAGVHYRLGAYDRAIAMFERALAIRRTSLGDQHPLTAGALTNIANIQFTAGNYTAARVGYEQALDIQRRARGERSTAVAHALTNVGNVQWIAGETEQAKQSYRRALDIQEAANGPSHPSVADALHNLAALHAEIGDFATARTLGTRALTILETAYGPDHLELASTLSNLGDALRNTGSRAEARAAYDRAIALWESRGEHPDLAHALVGAASLSLDEGDATKAVREAERAVAIRERADSPDADVAVARFVLARALWEAGTDRPRARSLAEQASAFAAAATTHVPIQLADLAAWLAAHPL